MNELLEKQSFKSPKRSPKKKKASEENLTPVKQKTKRGSYKQRKYKHASVVVENKSNIKPFSENKSKWSKAKKHASKSKTRKELNCINITVQDQANKKHESLMSKLHESMDLKRERNGTQVEKINYDASALNEKYAGVLRKHHNRRLTQPLKLKSSKIAQYQTSVPKEIAVPRPIHGMRNPQISGPLNQPMLSNFELTPDKGRQKLNSHLINFITPQATKKKWLSGNTLEFIDSQFGQFTPGKIDQSIGIASTLNKYDPQWEAEHSARLEKAKYELSEAFNQGKRSGG